MAESRTKSNSRHLARVLETGAALIGHGDADAPPARLSNAHFTAIRTLGGESEAAETLREAIRARRNTPIAASATIVGHATSVAATETTDSRTAPCATPTDHTTSKPAL